MSRREISAQTFLAALPLFKSLDAPTLARLAAAISRRALARGERLFARGDVPTGLYVVIHGEVKLLAGTASGSAARLTGVVGAGQSFGEAVMFLERPALVDAVAATDALVLHLPKDVVFAEIDRNPRFARLMIANLSQRVEALVNEIDRLAQGTGRSRLIAYLRRRAADAPGPQVVTLPATKADVASQLHLTPEHFSRLLHELAAEGLVQVQGRRIVLADVRQLANA